MTQKEKEDFRVKLTLANQLINELIARLDNVKAKEPKVLKQRFDKEVFRHRFEQRLMKKAKPWGHDPNKKFHFEGILSTNHDGYQVYHPEFGYIMAKTKSAIKRRIQQEVGRKYDVMSSNINIELTEKK
jgi:sulfite reductase beta subunit-like hemoprotein